MGREYVAIDGYVVKVTRDKSIGIVKAKVADIERYPELIWLPISQVENGELVVEGDTDLSVASWLAEDRELDY